jgi:elongation factor G
MLDALSMFNDELTEAMLEEQGHPRADPQGAIRKATIALKLTPVLMGSAYKNKGVQLLLDGVTQYLPDPTEVTNRRSTSTRRRRRGAGQRPRASRWSRLAFKLEDGRYGQLTYIRVYQGTLRRATHHNMRTGKKVKVGRLVRMHSDEMEDIDRHGPATSSRCSASTATRATPSPTAPSTSR